MPKARVGHDLEMHYLIDDFTDPWKDAETILMLHGNSESGAVWFGWVPHLARHFHVVRPDMRGYGKSTPMPRDFPWSLDVLISDFVGLMRMLGIERFHLIGAKIGGTIARAFAARCPERVRSLTVVGAPPPRYEVPAPERAAAPAVAGVSAAPYAARIPAWTAEFEQKGIEAWARRTMAGRLGSSFPPAGVEWWVNLMKQTPVSTSIGFISTIPLVDISPDLPLIQCPTLVITAEGSAYSSIDETRAWQAKIPRSRLVVLPGDSYHVAASDPERCARETLHFILSCDSV